MLAAVLTHELAHVRRKDALIALAAGINKAAFWFHPLAWWLERKLALLAEEASDDCALLVLGDRCRYASTLVELTAAARGHKRILWGAIAMARPSTLRRRIDRVLDGSRRLSGGLSRRRWITLLLGSAVMLCGAAALQLQTAPPPPPVPAPGRAAPQDQAQRDARLRAQLASPYQKWLTEDVAYIISAEERATFTQLSNDQQRENFIEDFWLRRDPAPGTLTNEFKEEHYRRIAYANDRFASKLPGWKTDRGRIYITFGPPDEMESHPSGAQGSYPYEVWRYRWIEGMGDNVELRFEDQGWNGEYRLNQGPKPPDLAAAEISGVTDDALSMQVQVDYTRLNDSSVLARLTVTFLSKGSPLQLAKDAQVLRVNIYGRITALANGRVLQTFDDTVPLVAQAAGSQEAGNAAFTFSKSIRLSPMDYRLTMVAKDLATGRTVTWEQTITVPGGA
jgi:GWxTD domain-containing protein